MAARAAVEAQEAGNVVKPMAAPAAGTWANLLTSFREYVGRGVKEGNLSTAPEFIQPRPKYFRHLRERAKRHESERH